MVLDILAEGVLNYTERIEKIGITVNYDTLFPQPIAVEISASKVVMALHGDMQALKSIRELNHNGNFQGHLCSQG